MKPKNILCYGDSNTWGFVPVAHHDQPPARYPRNIRWTGLLQQQLGQKAHIIEEGLNGRTTDVNHICPPDRNGKTYLAPCLYSQAPMDLVIIALGGNDFKTYFNRDAKAVCAGMAELVDMVQSSPYGPNFQAPPQVLIVTPGLPLPIAEKHIDENGVHFMEGCSKKAEELIPLYEALAKEKNCHFLDTAHKCQASEIDGVHLDEKGHAQMADLMLNKLNSIFGFR